MEPVENPKWTRLYVKGTKIYAMPEERRSGTENPKRCDFSRFFLERALRGIDRAWKSCYDLQSSRTETVLKNVFGLPVSGEY